MRQETFSVSQDLEALAREYDRRADSLKGKQPASTAHEVIASYRYAARTVRSAAKRIRHQANRIGF